MKKILLKVLLVVFVLTAVVPAVTVNAETKNKGKKDSGEYSIDVNIAENVVTVYKKDDEGEMQPIKAMVCSSGREDHDTPTGEFKIYERYDWRLMVDNTYGRYAVRFNGQIMFHSVPYLRSNDKNSLEWEEYNKLGTRASLGCIRLCVADAKWIYDNCKNGTKVSVFSKKGDLGPLGKPEGIKIDKNSKNKGFDPTDLTKENPWLKTIE